MAKESTITEYIIAQLEQPVLTTQLDENGKKVKRNATDPRDGHDQTPIAYGIYQIYRKRYLARYLQECGMQVWVDLNVSHRFAEYNLLGVPDGYNAFFTRGVTGWTPTLELHFKQAQRISHKEQPNMYVYGGGKEIERWCQDHGLRYLDEFMNIKRSSMK